MHTQHIRESFAPKELLDRTKEQDLDARNQLTLRNKWLVPYVIRIYNYSRYNDSYEDLYQDGMIGLIHGIQKYSESDRQYTLSTYVIPHIRNGIAYSLPDYQHMRMSHYATKQRHSIRGAKNRLKKNEKGTPKQIAALTGISPERQRAIHRTTFEFIPFYDSSYGSLGESPHRRSHTSKYMSDLGHEQRRILEKVEARIMVEQALQSDRLNNRERYVLIHYFGLFGTDPQTGAELSAQMGITRERIRQIREKALRRMRHPSVSQGLYPHIW